jgi:hypothetical protein
MSKIKINASIQGYLLIEILDKSSLTLNEYLILSSISSSSENFVCYSILLNIYFVSFFFFMRMKIILELIILFSIFSSEFIYPLKTKHLKNQIKNYNFKQENKNDTK